MTSASNSRPVNARRPRARLGGRLAVRAAGAALALFGLAGPLAVAGPADAAAVSAEGYPELTSISPAVGPMAGGIAFTVTGSNLLGSSPTATKIDFGFGHLATDVTCTATSCTGKTPPGGEAFSYSTNLMVSVDNAPWSVTNVYYTFRIPPTITGLSPSTGPSAGGNWVTLTGTGLNGTDSVSFGSNYVAYGSCSSDTTCSMQAPPGTRGIVDVKAHHQGGWSTPTPASRYAYDAPTVTAISPNTGPTTGGNKVTLTGTNLTGATITFGPGRNATAVTCTATSCTATAPAAPASKVNIQATTIAGTSPANNNQNLYLYQ